MKRPLRNKPQRTLHLHLYALLFCSILFLGKTAEPARAQDQGPAAAPAEKPSLEIPSRPENTPSELIDLSAHYNASLTRGWHPETNVAGVQDNNLERLPRGVQTLSGVPFDIRGLIQLDGRSLHGWGGNFPPAVQGIAVGQAARRLHFLHGTGWQERDGTTIGFYRVHYADGETARIPIVYGEDVRDWWFWREEPLTANRSKLAWTGANRSTDKQGMSLRLYLSTWENPAPEKEIDRLDYVTAFSNCAPFLIAVTAETRDAIPAHGESESLEAAAAGLDSPFRPQLLVQEGWKASWSPDGKRLAYGKTGGGIAILDLQTGEATDLIREGKDPAWSPDGRFIAYAIEPGRAYYSEEIWVAAAGGGKFFRIGYGGFPSWSADGRRVFFHDRERGQILAVEVDASDFEPKVFFEGALSWYPAISPDESRIAFGAREALVVVDRSGEVVARLPVPGGRGLLPAWSPDGRQVAFGGFAGSRVGVWIYDLERGGAFQIAGAGNCTMPAWSPDGKRLAFDYRGRPEQVWVLETGQLPANPNLVSQLPAPAPPAGVRLPPGAPHRPPPPPLEPKLKVGDPAPQLRVAKWVQGEPVEAFEPGTAYLVEFWATWCGPCITSIPHLNVLHQRFKDQGLVVIGQNVWEQDETAVEPFIRKMGDKMTYRVATDDKSQEGKGAMSISWMEAANRNGIPVAFLVDRQGRIAWIGHPMALDEKLLELLLAQPRPAQNEPRRPSPSEIED